MERFKKIIKAEKLPIYMIYFLVGLTIANEMWDLQALNGVVGILSIAVLVFRKFIK